MMRRQYELVEVNGEAVMIVWLPVDPRVKLRSVITIKEIPDTKWLVTEVFVTEQPDQEFHRKWNVDYMEKLPGLKLASKA